MKSVNFIGWYVGGQFTSIQGYARSGLARLFADGTVDPTLVSHFRLQGYHR